MLLVVGGNFEVVMAGFGGAGRGEDGCHCCGGEWVLAGVVVKGKKGTGRGSEFRWWRGSIGS
jgi:hypothetical protein